MSPANEALSAEPAVHRFWADWPALHGELTSVQAVIAGQVEEGGAALKEALRESVRSDGKMLRPAFLLLSAQFGAYEAPRFHALAAGIEMLHMATLAHDDIIDDSPLRRGRPSLHVARGSREAVLLGDWLFSRCFRLMADHASPANARSLAGIVSRICGSEVEQAAARYAVDGSLRGYLRRIAGKTALLMALSFAVGAGESGCAEGLQTALRRIGYSIGMGFQIIDDVLDWDGVGRDTGKPVMADLRQGIFTLPVLLALRRDDGELGRMLSSFRGAEEQIPRIGSLVRARGGVEEARGRAALYTRRALQGIEGLPESDPRDALGRIAARLLKRAY